MNEIKERIVYKEHPVILEAPDCAGTWRFERSGLITRLAARLIEPNAMRDKGRKYPSNLYSATIIVNGIDEVFHVKTGYHGAHIQFDHGRPWWLFFDRLDGFRTEAFAEISVRLMAPNFIGATKYQFELLIGRYV